MRGVRAVSERIFHYHHQWRLNMKFPVTPIYGGNPQHLFERNLSSMPMQQQSNASNGCSAMDGTSQKQLPEMPALEDQLCPDAPLSFDTHKLVRYTSTICVANIAG